MNDPDPDNSSQPPDSDAGGVAARRGFKYQDHVAAGFVLEMIGDPSIIRVECETADDIVLVHQGQCDVFEYVQVKTTEGDTKWTQKEICERDSGNGRTRPTSLIEKSLLTDTRTGQALFRIVSRRDVNKTLAPLKTDMAVRARHPAPISGLADKFAKKWPTASPNGRTLGDWARHAVWQVAGDVEGLYAKNLKRLILLAERHGANPTHSHSIAIYDDLLAWVDRLASASRATEAEKKLVDRQTALDWWNTHLAETEAAQRRVSKPYKPVTDAFLAELHHLSEDDIRRALTGYDARYELKRWRSEQLAEYLADWLPEMTLKASELVEIQHLNLRQKMKAAYRQVESNRDIEPSRLLAEILLHAVLRHRFASEPVACKLFYRTASGTKTFGNAHIVHSGDRDELWLGRAALTTASDYDNMLLLVCGELSHVLDPDFLKDEREVILTLREPQHMLPTTLDTALSRLSPVDDLLEVLCVPILIGYDSSVLSAGFDASYRDRLIEELLERYAQLKLNLPDAIAEIRVHVFLVPIECVATLLQQFVARLGHG